MHENDSEGLKDVNVIKQEIHEKGDESGAIVLLNKNCTSQRVK